jgi:nicotinamidase-related amidase
MNAVIELRAYTNPALVPTLVLVDMQQEYIAAPRGLAIANAAPALENCALALKSARAAGLPIAHVRWTGRSNFFNPATPFAKWIDGFFPLGSEMIFERSRPSCYASNSFAEIMEGGEGEFVLAGFAGESACLSTLIDAFHRGHRVTYLADASASHALEDFDSSEAHRMVLNLARLYGRVVQTRDWIAGLGRRVDRWEAAYAGDGRST